MGRLACCSLVSLQSLLGALPAALLPRPLLLYCENGRENAGQVLQTKQPLGFAGCVVTALSVSKSLSQAERSVTTRIAPQLLGLSAVTPVAGLGRREHCGQAEQQVPVTDCRVCGKAWSLAAAQTWNVCLTNLRL